VRELHLGAVQRRVASHGGATVGRDTRRRTFGTAISAIVLLVAGGLFPAAGLAEDGPGSIGGIVYDPLGMHAADVIVSACSGPCKHAISSPTGAYSITGLAAGNYRVGITDELGNLAGGYATATGTTVNPAAAALVPVGVGAAVFDVHATAGRRISGIITTATAAPIADALVQACIVTDVPDTGFLPCGVDLAAADGTYSLTVLPATYKLSAGDLANAWATGYYSTSGYVLPWRLATPLAVTTADLTGINLALPPGISIAGTVTDNTGAALENIDVGACLVNAIDGCLYAATAVNGSYSINALPAGSFYVIFSDPAALQPTGFYGSGGFVGDSGQAAAVTPTGSGATGIDVKLPIGHVISGTVRDAAGKAAVVDVQDCTTRFCVPLDTTGTDGAYRINVASGTHYVHASDYTGVNLSGYYSATGLANALHATSLSVSTMDLSGIDIRLRRITGGIHGGTSHSGTFVASTTVTKGAYATARFLLTKPFAGSKVTISRAIKNSSGSWSSYKSVATVVVASNGYVYYSARINGNYRYQASLTDPLTVGVKVVSVPVYVRPR
jgi:hypothetical protein